MPRRRFLAGAAALGVLAACGDDSEPSVQPDAVATEPVRVRYAEHDVGFGELWLPDDPTTPVPVVVLVHGGFWHEGFSLDLMTPLVPSLAALGVAVWNIEYRRVGGRGGWPETFHDVAAAVDAVEGPVDDAADGRLDAGRVVLVGHSAGGHLATWAASRQRLPTGVPGSRPLVRPRAAVSLAGVLDLVACAGSFGAEPCSALLGGTPAEVPDRYAAASPIELVPIGVPVVAIHGSDDAIVPLRQSSDYVDAGTAAGDPADLVVVDGADHADLIDPGHQGWAAALDRLAALVPAG